MNPDWAARGRWDNVMRLPPGSVVDVLSMDGAAYVGGLTAADGWSVSVNVNGIDEPIPRADVLRIDLVDLPGSEVRAVARQAGIGAVLGAGAAALVAGVIGGSAWPPPGALLRGGAAIGGVAGGSAALAARQGRIVYLAEHQGVMPIPPFGAGSRGERDRSARVVRSLPAREWTDIADLAAGEHVRVVRTNGVTHAGALVGVDDTSMRLDVGGAELRILRSSVVRVDVIATFPREARSGTGRATLDRSPRSANRR
jgi:hypothetical protein